MGDKKPYKKPTIQEVRLHLEEQILAACRSARSSTTNSRATNRACSRCRTTYSAS
jgi:hypothetical protein